MKNNKIKYCPECGTQNPPDANYCCNCPYQFNSGKGKIIAIVSLITVVGAGIYFLMSSGAISTKDMESVPCDTCDIKPIEDISPSTKQVIKRSKKTSVKDTVKISVNEVNSDKTISLNESPKEQATAEDNEPPSHAPTIQHIVYPSGEIYTGHIDNIGRKYGQGTYEWPSGNKYVGNFDNDKMKGKGTLYYASGDIVRYEGYFDNGKIHGNGILYIKQGNIITREGYFKNGLLDGEVIDTYKNGDTKTHVWKNGKLIK